MVNPHWPAERRSVILIAIVVFITGALVGSWTTVRAGHLPLTGTPVLLRVSSATGAATGREVSFTNGFSPVAKQVLPTVVNIASSKIIRSTGRQSSPFFSDPFFRQFFGDQLPNRSVPLKQREQSLGSGVIVNPAGYILTNNHVVDGASEIKVTLSDNREFNARLVGTDPKADIAVVKIDANNLPAITLGDSSGVQVGDFALAVGNPFGVGRTVTMGIISATGRNNLGIEDYEDFIQTDAAINPGNSGGALVNVDGQLIGINTAIITGGGGGNQGVGLAVPVNMAKLEMEQILRHGKVIRGWLGVEIQPLTPDMAKAFGVSGSGGAVVADVTQDGPAARSGLKSGDVIVDLNGKPVADSRQLSLSIAQTAPGTAVKLQVLRDGRQQEFTATLGEQPSKQQSGPSATGGGGGPHLGISVENLTPDLTHQLGLSSGTKGVAISGVESGSPAEAAGLQQGDVIQQVNRKPVGSANEFMTAIRSGGDQPVLLLIDRGGSHLYVMVSLH